MTMTDERLAELDAAYAKQAGTPFGENWIHLNTAAKHHIFAAYPDLRAMIDAQAATIAGLVEALKLADASLRGANMNMNVVERKVRAALEGAAS